LPIGNNEYLKYIAKGMPYGVT